MKEDHQIEWSLLVRIIRGSATPEEEKIFQEWQEDPENRIYFEKAKTYFDRYYSGNEERHVDKQGAWNEFLNHTRRTKPALRVRLLKYAAILILPLLCSWLAYTWIEKTKNQPSLTAQEELLPGETKAVLVLGSGEQIQLSNATEQDTLATENNVVINRQANGLLYNRQGKSEPEKVARNTIMTPRGGEYQVTLSDGTHITLNAESKLVFPVEFPDDIRQVKLIGEAYFEVARNTGAPFIVETKAGKIKVLGTSFNISAYSDDKIVQTTLVSGSVSYISPATSEEEIIVPGEQITYDKINRSTRIQKVNTDIFCGWRDGKFILEGERLEDIMKRLTRWYDIEVFFQNEAAKDLVFTGDLEKYEKCDVILDIIELSTNVRFNIRGRTVTVMMQH